MPRPETHIHTECLILRSWRESDHEDFARLHASADTMRNYRGPLSAADSRTKLRDYIQAYREHGFIR